MSTKPQPQHATKNPEADGMKGGLGANGRMAQLDKPSRETDQAHRRVSSASRNTSLYHSRCQSRLKLGHMLLLVNRD